MQDELNKAGQELEAGARKAVSGLMGYFQRAIQDTRQGISFQPELTAVKDAIFHPFGK